MRCFNCGGEIVNTGIGYCANCLAILNETKTNFISYIGAPDSLVGYQKSYKLLLLKCVIEVMLDDGEASVERVIPAIKEYYLNRKNKGLQPDYDVDSRISEIENSSDYDVFAVIKSQPFKVINEKGYLFLNHNSSEKLIFVFNEDIVDSMSCDEWTKLLRIVNAKLSLYYERYDGLTNVSATTEKMASVHGEGNVARGANIDLSLSVFEITNLSVRAKNTLMRNKLYTVGAVLNFIRDNDLRSLKNMGQKTYEEIMTLIQAFDLQTSASSEPNSIASLFEDNIYHLFVEFCERNCLSNLSDLENFNFELLLNEPGFGTGELEAIKEKYYSLLQDNCLSQDCEELSNNLDVAFPTITIDPSNVDLDIPYLRFAGISAKNNAKFFENGFSKIGDLSKISLGKLVQMFGQVKGIETFEKIKVFEQPLLTIATDRLNRRKDSREFAIYVDRANKKTLQEIANNYNITRERVRQIETKFFREFSPLFGSLVEQYMIRNNLSYITTQDVLEFFDDNTFDTVIMYTLKESSSLEYLPFADMFIKKQSESQDTVAKLRKITTDFIGKEGINFFECLPKIEEMLNDSDLGFLSADTFLNYLIESGAHFYGDFVFLKKQPYVKLCLILISKHFKEGITLYSDEDINLLRNLFHAEYGAYDLPEQNRAISARLSDCLITCDRGKAKLIENINYDPAVIEDIKKYIDTSSLNTLYFSEIFNEFEGVLAFTSDITNYHGLHGLLAYLYRDEYEFSKDCITKKNGEGKSFSLSDRIVMLIVEKGRAVTRNEIKQKIGGLSDIMIVNAINSSKKLLQWDYNSFNALDNLIITADDEAVLTDILEAAFAQCKGYCSDGLLFEKVKLHSLDFISKNRIENPTNLFYVLQKIWGDKYQFSRPHICQKDTVDSLTTKSIALYLLGTTQQISRTAFMQIAKNVHWSETTADLIFYELEKDYTRISEDVYISSKNFYIEESALIHISNWLQAYISRHDYLSMIGFDDFENFPHIQYDWNSFLLISVIKKYNLGVKLISPAIRDRRYNKEVVVCKDSDCAHLDDIVYALLVKNNIKFIDEANLLSFLVINHLVAKVIPKELFDSKKLDYADGYFNIK